MRVESVQAGLSVEATTHILKTIEKDDEIKNFTKIDTAYKVQLSTEAIS